MFKRQKTSFPGTISFENFTGDVLLAVVS